MSNARTIPNASRKPVASKTILLTVELEPHEAAALMRLCKKFGHSDASAYLYGHLPKELRDEQAYDMVHAANHVWKALEEADVSDWPWIENRAARAKADL